MPIQTHVPTDSPRNFGCADAAPGFGADPRPPIITQTGSTYFCFLLPDGMTMYMASSIRPAMVHA